MLAELVQSITTFVEQIVNAFGPVGIGIVAFMENVFPLTPSELVYPLAGKMAHDGYMSPIAVILAAVTGVVIGSLTFYSFGYIIGEDRIRGFIQQYGILRLWRWRVPIVKLHDYDRAMALFRRHGPIIVLVARTIPLIHGVVSIPAGVARMNLLLFMGLSAVGGSVWVIILTLFGYWLGDQWEQVLYWLDVYERMWLVVITVGLVLFIGRRLWNHRARRRPAL